MSAPEERRQPVVPVPDAPPRASGSVAPRPGPPVKPIPDPEPADPRKQISRLPDRSPFVMLPVRIETRFGHADPNSDLNPQLWVRIYPDDCSIDTFEETLSAGELANVKLYWQSLWQAGGRESAERAAWRTLVAAHGSGRAGYLLDTYRPVNLAERPTGAHAEEEILVIPTHSALEVAQASALSTYWSATWRAGEDAAEAQAATSALEAALGATRAQELIAAYAPFNLSDTPTPPATRAGADCTVAYVLFPEDPAVKEWSWTQAPQASQLPDRFVVLGYNDGAQTLEAIGSPVRKPLYVGPDPSVAPEDTIHPEGEALIVPEELRWLVDFDEAIAAGMALAIDLEPLQAQAGFDRLLVLGVQLGSSETEGKAALEGLLSHHHRGLGGLEILAQGTPTHNSAQSSAGYGRGSDSDYEASFEDLRSVPLFTPESDPHRRRDGQCVAEALGIDASTLQAVHGADGQDQLRGRAMQRALWPATVGYMMDKMLTPMFSDETIARARWFFANHVRGRGSVPALRIGGQPYGILPTTAFSRIAWLAPEHDGTRASTFSGARPFMVDLLEMLRKIEPDWNAMASGAAYVGKPGDPHQTLLDVLALQSGAVEYHWRDSESMTEIYNMWNLAGPDPKFWEQFFALWRNSEGEALLERLGWTGETPEILQHAFMAEAGTIENIVEARPLSESEPLAPSTEAGGNYLNWLIDAARTSLDQLREEQGFNNGQSPQALLYLYMRHALLLGYFDAGYELHRSAGLLTPVELQAMKPEPHFIHVQEGAPGSESRYAPLYKAEAQITHSPTQLIADYIHANLATLPEAGGLVDQLEALEALADAPTAQLERAFAEHIDTCSYRFDAWLLGLVSAQLEAMRAVSPIDEQTGGQAPAPAAGGGAYLGAYAWVEDLRPSQSQLKAVRLPDDLEESFGPAAGEPLMQDAGNGGYVIAPSLTHARSAAVLRSGYIANASSENPETLAVNLSSERVRVALSLLEGIRNGQSVGALLGYNFERGLHDAFELAEVDKFIFPLRKAFPLAADALAATATGPEVPIEAIQASNVMDGRKLAEHIRQTGNASYPFGLTALPAADAAETEAIDQQAGALADAYDAVADLALAEGVHQAVQGNFERVAATLDAYSNASFPPDPEVVQTPTPGTGLTHRVALQLTPGLSAPAGATPRAVAEPALDAWLESMLPALSTVGCEVTWSDPVTATPRTHAVTLAELGLCPLDVLELLRPEDVQAMSELDDRVLRFVYASASPRPDAVLSIHYREAPAGMTSIFATSALVQSLRTLLAGTRALRATDAIPQREASPQADEAIFVQRARVAEPKTLLDALGGEVEAFLKALGALTADPVSNRPALLAEVDSHLDGAIALLERAGRFGLPQAGWGFAYEWRRSALAGLLAAIGARVTSWEARLADFDAAIAAYDALPSTVEDSARFLALQAAEALVTLTLDQLPAKPATMRGALPAKRLALATVTEAFATATNAAYAGFHEALAAAQALPAIGEFDADPLDLSPFEEMALDVRAQVVTILAGHLITIDERRQQTQTLLEAHDHAGGAAAQATALEQAAAALLGEAFVLIPEFSVSNAQGTQWEKALAASASGESLEYLTATVGIARPVEEWLSGAARVRTRLNAWEMSAALASALAGQEPKLQPAQLPYSAGEPWLAMQTPEAFHPEGERMLYTAHYATPFVLGQHQCGLLLDEWTEVIPATSKEAGLTFNFDRPDNEAPQSILLVTPASATGMWVWEDLVGALNETLDLAKKRALEPAQIEASPYAPLLPATIMAVTLYGISISTALAVSDGVLATEEVARRA